MKKLIFLILISFAHGLHAQTYKQMANKSECIDKLKKQAASTKTIQADFTEKKYSAMFKTPKTGTGKFYYKKENMIRWENLTPVSNIVLIKDKTMKVSENGKEIKQAGNNIAAKKIQEMMVQLMTFSFTDEKDFSIKYFESESNYKIELTPKNKRMSKYISVIELIFDKTSVNLNQLTLGESDTEKMVYNFSGHKFNQEIADSKFTKF